jgi:hypothetical protein
MFLTDAFHVKEMIKGKVLALSIVSAVDQVHSLMGRQYQGPSHGKGHAL